MSPRTGRPKSENPKKIKYSVRLDEETENKLKKYCALKNITRGEAFRQGILLLIDEKE